MGAPLGSAAFAGEPMDVYVGYSGGPYYLKRSYSVDDLEGLAVGPYTYSAIDNKPSLVKYVAWGVPLETLFATAIDAQTGYPVNTGALWRLAFDTTDNYKPDNGVYGNDAWYWDNYSYYTGRLLNTAKTPRYYYPAFGENFNYSTTSVIAGRESAIAASGTTVPSMIALRYTSSRITSLAQWQSFDSLGFGDLGNGTNRLVYGQAYVADRDVENELHSINGVYCIYQGKPEVMLDQSAIKGNIGETVTIRASITASDPLIAQEGVKDIRWASSNESVATVHPNGDGSAKVVFRGKGDVQITATFGNSSSAEFVASGAVTASGPGGSGFRGDGEGEGKDYGEGDGEQGPGVNRGDGENDGFQEEGGAGTSEDGQPDDSGGSADNSQNGSNLDDTQATGYFTSVPSNAIPVSIASASQSVAAASGQDLEGGAGDSVGSEEQAEREEQRIYRINTDATPLADTSDQAVPEPSTVGLPLVVTAGVLVLLVLGGLLQALYYYRCLDRSAGFDLRELFARSEPAAA